MFMQKVGQLRRIVLDELGWQGRRPAPYNIQSDFGV